MGLKNDLIHFSRLCGNNGFVKAYDGNLSARTRKNYILSTASKTNKAQIKITDLIKCDLKGKKISGKSDLTTEIKLHLFIYNKRKDINAIIHAHPLYITSYAAAGKKLPLNILPEIYLMFKDIPLAKYAAPSTDELPLSIEPYVMEHNAVVLGNHGIVAYGSSMNEAYYLIEKLEQYAGICFNAKLLGGAKPITKTELKKLDELKTTNYKSYLGKK